jgi:hypothetical protein
MKANELRIGNYLQGKSRFVKVTKIYSEHAIGIGSGDPYYVSGENPCLTPIPLTEEWLLKFGFLHSLRLDDFMFKKGNDCFQIQPYKEGFSNSVLYNDMEIVDRLQHVHQLQNLYFALTGEELTIDEQ